MNLRLGCGDCWLHSALHWSLGNDGSGERWHWSNWGWFRGRNHGCIMGLGNCFGSDGYWLWGDSNWSRGGSSYDWLWSLSWSGNDWLWGSLCGKRLNWLWSLSWGWSSDHWLWSNCNWLRGDSNRLLSWSRLSNRISSNLSFLNSPLYWFLGKFLKESIDINFRFNLTS